MEMVHIRLLFAFFSAILSVFLARQDGRDPIKWMAIGGVLGFFGILPIFFFSFKRQKKGQKTAISSTKIYFIDGPPDKFWYYLDSASSQLGPMSFNALSRAWKEGKINALSYVWHEDLSDWKPLKEFIKEEKV